VNLTKGTEYTVEISKGSYYQYAIGSSLPDIEIINPQGNALNFLDLGESYDVNSELFLDDDVIELSVYPEENPYMICLTFTPAETDSYTINLCQPVSEDTIEDDITLFVYEELRNDDDNTAGYYRRYKFIDKEGNLSRTINMNDVMALRKAWNEAANSLLYHVEGHIISGDEVLPDEDLDSFVNTTAAQIQTYLDCVSRVKQYYGIFDDYKESDYYQEFNSYDSDSESESEVTAAANNEGTKIPAEIYGISYENYKFTLGGGFFAITGTQAKSSAIDLSKRRISIPKNKQLKSLYKAGFISSQEDAEAFAATTVDGALQLGGFGFETAYSNSSSFKFGLTSTTFVIHYEATEPQYRTFEDDEDYVLKTTLKLRWKMA